MCPECGQAHSIDWIPRWIKSRQTENKYCCCCCCCYWLWMLCFSFFSFSKLAHISGGVSRPSELGRSYIIGPPYFKTSIFADRGPPGADSHGLSSQSPIVCANHTHTRVCTFSCIYSSRSFPLQNSDNSFFHCDVIETVFHKKHERTYEKSSSLPFPSIC